MEKSKVISVRMPESLIKELDQMAVEHHYWTRNAVICAAVYAITRKADSQTQKHILRSPWDLDNDWKLVVVGL